MSKKNVNLTDPDFYIKSLNSVFKKIFSVFTKSSGGLHAFEEVKRMSRPYSQTYKGLQEIELDKIIGSVGRYKDFDKEYQPLTNSTSSRRERIAEAYERSEILPPINLYKIGKYYFVADGNHRVSVAKQKKAKYIDAYVTELKTRVEIKRDMDMKDLILLEMHSYFLEKTRLQELCHSADILLTAPVGYEKLLNHIEYFAYLTCEERGEDIPRDDIIRIWYYDFYLPAKELVLEANIIDKFPGRKPGDLFVWILDHWGYLTNKKGRPLELKEVIQDFSENNTTKDMINRYYKLIKVVLFIAFFF